MASVSIYPMQDQFKTKLTQEYDGVSTGSIYVQETPSFTVPSGKTYCVVISPNTSIQQSVIIDAHNSSAKTMNVSDASINKGPGLTYTQSTHPVGSEVIITDNFAHWEELVNVVDGKLDQTGGTVGSFSLGVTGSNWRIRKDGNDMKFRDDNQSEVTLSTIASSGSDEKTKVSVSDTTAGYLNSKLTAGDGISKTTVNPGGDESIDLDIDLSDTTIFSATQVSGKVPLLNGSGRVTALINGQSDGSATSSEMGLVRMSTNAGVITGTNESDYINPKQGNDNYSRVVLAGTSRTLATLPTTRSTTSTTFVELKRFTVGSTYKSGTYTISYDWDCGSNAASGILYRDLRKNGTSIDLFSITPNGVSPQSGNRSNNYTLVAGDVISLWLRRTNAAGTTPATSNMLCRYNLQLVRENTITATVNVD